MLQKQAVSINFSKGIDTKTDKNQLPIGQFAALNNVVFNTVGQLTKRNGYPTITQLPNLEQTTLTTLNDNLIATGSNLYAYSQDTNQWLNQGTVQPVQLSTQSLVRVSTSQTSPDAAVSASGLVCLTYMDSGESYYQVSDSRTGQQIVPRTLLPNSAVDPRVFILGLYFVVTFVGTISATKHLQYISMPINLPSSPAAVADISASVASSDVGYDAFAANNNLYFGWAGAGNTVQLAYLTSNLIPSAPTSIAGHTANRLSLTVDVTSTPIIWITFWDSGSTNLYTAALDQFLNFTYILAPTLIGTGLNINALTSVASNSLLTVFIDNVNTYTWSPNARTDFISKATVAQSGTVVAPANLLLSVGLASKAYIDPSGTIYMLTAYGESTATAGAQNNEPTYFLIDDVGNIIMRLAGSNAGGFATTQVLPSLTLLNDNYYTVYLIKDFLASKNSGTNLPTGTPTNAIYTQTGVNLAVFEINTSGQHSSEIAGTLHLTGGQLWEYDGVMPVEHGFHVYPENINVIVSGTSGNVGTGTYYYQFCYEWTDNAGNLHRSAPSVPMLATVSSPGITVILQVPTDRLTYKLHPNPIRIVGYRWSAAQPVYYQFTSLTSPPINETFVDYINIFDQKSDAEILGNTILYTTGGVIENIAAPASIASALFKNRLFIIDAEDQNLLWYSKQVIENTPVEMSDLLTLYVAPTTGAQGSTGPMRSLGAMDDKLIIFKKDAAYYLTGTGPDNTGGNNDFSDPVYITSSVGCSNPDSIVLMPLGLMFQSDKGIWLLGRDLSTKYIGAPAEKYNSQTVVSASVIPGTNQVRFVLDNSITLMYDYYTDTWGTFDNIKAVSATLYKSRHTYLNSLSGVLQETPGVYLEGVSPVLVSFTTGWNNLAGLQGYERFYFANLLGTYYTPFKLNVSFAYDYNPSPTHNILVTPDNYSAPWGGEANWGAGQSWGGPGNVFSSRVFPEKQKCQSFQVTVTEVFDSTLGTQPGQGLSLSGLGLVVGIKRGYRTQSALKSYG